MDENNELIIYVLQQLRYGVPEQSIRQTLAQNGWPQPLVDRAFSMVQQAAPHNVPPTSYDQQAQSQMPEVALPATNELPNPATDPYQAIEEKQRSKRGKGVMRGLLITLSVLLLLAAASFGGYFIYKAIKQNSEDNKQPATIQTENNDTQRKNSLKSLSADLTSYYTAKNTYPTLAQINSADFADKDSGFSVAKYKDPKWDSDKDKACTSKDNQPVFAEGRTKNCFSYRVTASNGGDCDAVGTLCTRVVLTASLDGDKPYVIALDKNTEE